mmetsp:Transcript_16634/g.31506  ORF Transcript_16634/g.31506 Transcript_16634/m.31506 type:complete len:206 (+) Transcript_16634:155-772(+)
MQRLLLVKEVTITRRFIVDAIHSKSTSIAYYGRLFFPPSLVKRGLECRYFRGCSLSYKKYTQDQHQDGTADSSSVIIDGLEATSKWKRDQLNKISDKFIGADSQSKLEDQSQGQKQQVQQQVQQQQQKQQQPQTQPLQIDSDDQVQPMWRDMESRVVRRRSVTIAEALTKGMKIGRRNVRSTDEEAWLDAGLYHHENDNSSDKEK